MIDVLFHRIVSEETKMKHILSSHPLWLLPSGGGRETYSLKSKTTTVYFINGHVRVKMEHFDIYTRLWDRSWITVVPGRNDTEDSSEE